VEVADYVSRGGFKAVVYYHDPSWAAPIYREVARACLERGVRLVAVEEERPWRSEALRRLADRLARVVGEVEKKAQR